MWEYLADFVIELFAMSLYIEMFHLQDLICKNCFAEIDRLFL